MTIAQDMIRKDYYVEASSLAVKTETHTCGLNVEKSYTFEDGSILIMKYNKRRRLNFKASFGGMAR